jgi:hypothetical protein
MNSFIDSVLHGESKGDTPDYYAWLGCAPSSTVCRAVHRVPELLSKQRRQPSFFALDW